MAKFSGNVGFAVDVETSPGIWEPLHVERKMRGDVITMSLRHQPTSNLNDDIALTNRISLILDTFSYEHYHNLRYVEYLGNKWKVTSVDVQRPRLILTLGGVWNG